MASLTDYAENKLIDWLFRAVALSPPGTWYVALFTTNDNDAGSSAVEVAGNGYARVGLAASAANWAATDAAGSTNATSGGTNGTTSNNVAINFPTPSGSWGTITGVGLFDASTGGHCWAYAALATSRTVTDSGTPISFPAAALTFQMDN